MIIQELRGRLGNQMFEYALLRYLNITHGYEIKLDISYYKTGNRFNKFDLRHFNLPCFVATKREINRLKKLPFFRALFNKLIGKSVQSDNIYKEKSYAFDEDVLSINDSTYTRGYWQSEKYFKNIREILLKDFYLELNDENQKIIDDMKKYTSVGVHVRRGDYVSNPDAYDMFYQCNNEYYQKSAEYILDQYDNVKFYICTDDPEWVSKNIILPYNIEIVDINGSFPLFDMLLMSRCDHNIISNSTFSWWSGWLNKNKNKIVISPFKWYRDGRDESDLIPDTWVKMEFTDDREKSINS